MMEIVKYQLYLNGKKDIDLGPESKSHTFTELVPNTEYTVAVEAIYDDGTKLMSDEAKAKTKEIDDEVHLTVDSEDRTAGEAGDVQVTTSVSRKMTSKYYKMSYEVPEATDLKVKANAALANATLSWSENTEPGEYKIKVSVSVDPKYGKASMDPESDTFTLTLSEPEKEPEPETKTKAAKNATKKKD